MLDAIKAHAMLDAITVIEVDPIGTTRARAGPLPGSRPRLAAELFFPKALEAAD